VKLPEEFFSGRAEWRQRCSAGRERADGRKIAGFVVRIVVAIGKLLDAVNEPAGGLEPGAVALAAEVLMPGIIGRRHRKEAAKFIIDAGEVSPFFSGLFVFGAKVAAIEPDLAVGPFNVVLFV